MSQLLLPFWGGFAQRCLLPHAFMEMWQSMKALLLELDENGLKKKNKEGDVLGRVITRKSLKKLTQILTKGKSCLGKEWRISRHGLSDLLKEKIITRAPKNTTSPSQRGGT